MFDKFIDTQYDVYIIMSLGRIVDPCLKSNIIELKTVKDPLKNSLIAGSKDAGESIQTDKPSKRTWTSAGRTILEPA